MNRYINIIPCLIISLGLSAQTSGVFDETVNTIIENNPDMSAKKASFAASTDELETRNFLADPEIEFEHQWGHGDIGNKWSVNISQSFDWPGLYKSRAKSAVSGRQVLALMYMSAYIDTKLIVTRTLIDYVNALQLLQMHKELSANLDSISAYTQRAFDHGELTILDLKKVKFEQADEQLQLKRAESAVDRLRGEVIALNGGKYLDLSNLDSYRPSTLKTEDDYVKMLLDNDPALAAAELTMTQTRQDIVSARMSAFPGFKVGYIHNVEAGEKFDGFNIGVNLPVFSSRKRRAIAIANAEAAQYESDSYKHRALSNIKADYIDARALKENLSIYHSMFSENTDDYIELLRKSWQGGQITTIQLITEINYYTKIKIDYLNLIRDYNLALAQLNRFG